MTGRGKYKCKHCSLSYDSLVGVKEHVRRVHFAEVLAATTSSPGDAAKSAWEEDVNTIIESIEAGDLDDHLQQIIKACIARYEEVKGRSPLKRKQQRDDQGADDQGADEDGRVIIGDDRQQYRGPRRAVKKAVKRSPQQRTWKDHLQPNMIKALTASAVMKMDQRDIFGVGHLMFRRDDVYGHKCRIRPGSLDTDEYDGLIIGIGGLGPKSIKVEFLDDPPKGSSVAKRIADGKPIFMPYSILQPYLKGV